MAHEAILSVLSAPAAVDLSAKQYYAITFDTNNNANLANAGKNMDGVLQNKPLAGMAATVARDGETKVAITASATIAIGGLLQVDTLGTFTAFTTGTAVAKAREAVTGIAAVTIITADILRSNAGF